jgi:aminopeptidase
MLNEKHLARYADVLLWGLRTARSQSYKKGDIFLIRYHLPAIGLAEILEAKLLHMGMNPVQRLIPTAAMERNFFNIADGRQLIFTPPGEEHLYHHLNGGIYLQAPDSITHLSRIDPKKIATFNLSRKHLREILDQREERGQFGWTLCMLPTPELAQHAHLSMEAYTRQIINACFLNRKDPVARWQALFENARTMKKWLNSLAVEYYQVQSDHVDLKVTPGARRKWIGLSGHNIPSFELFISPDWRGTQGIYYADQPSYRSGNYVEGVRLEFKKGEVVKAQAKTGEAFVRQQLLTDKGSNKLGEFSLTDKRFSRIDRFMANTLFDENYGGKYGNCHVALGSSYSDTFDGNPAELSRQDKAALGFNDSALHWDLVNTEKKRVKAFLSSGAQLTIYENGKFLY